MNVNFEHEKESDPKSTRRDFSLDGVHLGILWDDYWAIHPAQEGTPARRRPHNKKLNTEAGEGQTQKED
jgi:hypothetical protein